MYLAYKHQLTKTAGIFRSPPISRVISMMFIHCMLKFIINTNDFHSAMTLALVEADLEGCLLSEKALLPKGEALDAQVGTISFISADMRELVELFSPDR